MRIHNDAAVERGPACSARAVAGEPQRPQPPFRPPARPPLASVAHLPSIAATVSPEMEDDAVLFVQCAYGNHPSQPQGRAPSAVALRRHERGNLDIARAQCRRGSSPIKLAPITTARRAPLTAANDRPAIRKRAQGMDMGNDRRPDRQPYRFRTRRQQQTVVGNGAAHRR